MSNFYEDASVVMVPSGYKTSKVYSSVPDDGSADLTFSRSNDTATRVGPDGLIEKVRTNLLLQSNSFDTTWGNDDSTETSGQSGYDGTNDAWLLSKTAANGRIGQVISVSGLATFSIYLKAGTKSWVRLASSDINVYAYFDLGTGVVGSTGASTTAKISSVGNGFYRCSISGNSSFSYFNIWVADADNDTSGTSGNILIQAAQLETGDVATDYIPTTTSAVSVGPLANIPRLDYSGGANSPSLLLEPQRTNLVTYSERFDNWSYGGGTITNNVAISPDGYQNADELSAGTYCYQAGSYGTCTFSVYRKYTTETNVALRLDTTGPNYIEFNIQNGTVGSLPSGFNASITDCGEGWYRCSVSSSASVSLVLISGASYTWGAQLEAGAYASSYIPTLSAAVTRGAEYALKTSISSLFGATATTFFLDFVKKENATGWTITGSNGTPLFSICQFDTLAGIPRIVFENALDTTSTLSPLSNGRHKLAISYAANDIRVYIDGALVLTDTAGTYYLFDRLGVNATAWTGFTNNDLAFELNQFLMIPSSTSNADLATLTTL